MKKVLILLLLLAIGLSYCPPIIAQQYGVELSAFTKKINTSYFYYNCFEQVQAQQDEFGITHYYAGVYPTYQQAKIIENQAKEKGYEHTQIKQSSPVSLTKNKRIRKQPVFNESRLFLKSFWCENESVYINKEDRQHLEEIVQLMKEDPSLRLRVIRPSKASTPIHHGRLKTISNFLMAKGIAPYRMRITNMHHDFLTAIEQVAASSSTPYSKNHQLIVTLINLKEEIIVNPTPPPSSFSKNTKYQTPIGIDKRLFHHSVKAVFIKDSMRK